MERKGQNTIMLIAGYAIGMIALTAIVLLVLKPQLLDRITGSGNNAANNGTARATEKIATAAGGSAPTANAQNANATSNAYNPKGNCKDGTETGSCSSASLGSMCRKDENGTGNALVEDCVSCACDSKNGMFCNYSSKKCYEGCIGGITAGECDWNRRLYCDNGGVLTINGSLCGCPDNWNGTNWMDDAYNISPKDFNLCKPIGN